MKIKLLTFALATGIAFSSALTAHAAPKASPTPAIPEPTPGPRPLRPLPFDGKIFAVDSTAKTFSTQNREKKIRIFAVTAETKISKKAGPATFEDLKIGEQVRGMATPQGDGNFDTQSVTIGAREETKPVALATPIASPSPGSTPRTTKKTHGTPTPTPSSKRTD